MGGEVPVTVVSVTDGRSGDNRNFAFIDRLFEVV